MPLLTNQKHFTVWVEKSDCGEPLAPGRSANPPLNPQNIVSLAVQNLLEQNGQLQLEFPLERRS